MHTDITFSWPNKPRREAPKLELFDPPAAVTPLEASDPDEAAPAFVEPDELVELRIELADARRTIARLEADRRTARLRIEELEDAERRAEEVIVSQRRRLVLLERRLEDLPTGMDFVPTRASWLDRLLGGAAAPRAAATVDA